MTHEQFNEFQTGLIEEVIRMKDTKGREYANSDNRFGNFDRLASEIGIPNYQVGWVLCKKHLDSIASYMKNGETYSSETIRGRFVDAIVYLTLIAGMVEEKNTIDPKVEITAPRYQLIGWVYGQRVRIRSSHKLGILIELDSEKDKWLVRSEGITNWYDAEDLEIC